MIFCSLVVTSSWCNSFSWPYYPTHIENKNTSCIPFVHCSITSTYFPYSIIGNRNFVLSYVYLYVNNCHCEPRQLPKLIFDESNKSPRKLRAVNRSSVSRQYHSVSFITKSGIKRRCQIARTQHFCLELWHEVTLI